MSISKVDDAQPQYCSECFRFPVRHADTGLCNTCQSQLYPTKSDRQWRRAFGAAGIRLSMIVGAVAVAANMALAPAAHAAPDPHIPNPSTGQCAGGDMGSPIYLGFCDGEPYPDGTQWHIFTYGLPVYGHPNGAFGSGGFQDANPGPNGAQCVMSNSGPIPAPAPPGGCGGAVR